MACFLAPTAEAIVMTVVKKRVEKKEMAKMPERADGEAKVLESKDDNKISFSRKLSWLTNLLWGGSFLLLIEHIWHGEVVPWAPFLTAMGNPKDTVVMLKEIATVGVSMAILCTLVWCCMLIVASIVEKKRAKKAESEVCA